MGFSHPLDGSKWGRFSSETSITLTKFALRTILKTKTPCFVTTWEPLTPKQAQQKYSYAE